MVSAALIFNRRKHILTLKIVQQNKKERVTLSNLTRSTVVGVKRDGKFQAIKEHIS